VISGPNAGGKTVILKAIGLAALMAKAGIHLPVEEGSCLPVLSRVFADIGDQQDIQQDFSTFSAHMRNIREILHGASRGALVLLDELAGSTDPQEGAALALAILERLEDKGALVVATTHYPQVKAWAQSRPGAQNAAMEFDWEKLSPTYRLRQGIPGQSSALEIARKMQLEEEVLELAARRSAGEEIRLEALLRDVQRQRSMLEEERAQAAALRARLQELVSSQEKLVRSLREERESFLREKRRRLSAELQEARDRIRGLLAGLAVAPDRRQLHQKRVELEELACGLREQPPLPPGKMLPLGHAKTGDQVEVIPLGQRGILLEDPSSGRARVRVLVGQMEVLVDVNALGGVESGSTEATKAGEPHQEPGRMGHGFEVPAQLDLRGKRAEEAIEELAQYLDRALLSPRQEVRIIHGHGTGALKRAVRQWLSGCSWICGFRPGVKGEGGDGVTMVALRGGGLQGQDQTNEPVERVREKRPRRG